MKAILLHHAGGDKYAFRNVEKNLSDSFTIRSLELPGRGDRFHEKLLTNFNLALHDLFTTLEPELYEPYFFVGVSMGVVFAYELTHLLQVEGLRLPNALFLSSRRSEEDYSDLMRVALSEREVFWEHILTYDEQSKQLLHHPELLEIVEPVLRADFQILEDYHDIYVGKNPLHMPAYILYGKQDVQKNNSHTSENWKKHFGHIIETRVFEGGHFFLYENEEAIQYIKSKLNNA